MALAAFLLWATRGLTFLQDEWDFIQYRLNWDADVFLNPHNQHLLATDVLVYKLLFAGFGIDSFLPYRAAAIAIHLLCVALLFELARRRLGTALGALVALPVAVLGTGWYVVINPFNMQWTLSLAALLGSALLLDRGDRRYDPLIALMVLAGLASSSLGVAVAVGVGARVLLEPGGLRRSWVVLAPLAIYAAWYVGYGLDADKAPDYHLTLSPAFLFHVAASGVGAVVGVPLREPNLPLRDLVVAGVHLLVLALAAAVVWVLAREGVRRHARLALPLGALLTFWVLLTASRGYGHLPYESHYAYAGAVMVLLLGVELAAVVRMPTGRGSPSPRSCACRSCSTRPPSSITRTAGETSRRWCGLRWGPSSGSAAPCPPTTGPTRIPEGRPRSSPVRCSPRSTGSGRAPGSTAPSWPTRRLRPVPLPSACSRPAGPRARAPGRSPSCGGSPRSARRSRAA